MAEELGRPLYGWQDIAGQYMTATADGKWLFPELAVVVGRQNGKTSLLEPRIIMGLDRGEKIVHTAQDRVLPRSVFFAVAEFVSNHRRNELHHAPRLANGSEIIEFKNGGEYRIVSPSRSGVRGLPNDIVIVDEVREMRDTDFIAAAQPTMTVSASPQMIYLSNAGAADSLVLNTLRARAADDPSIGYLEWSAQPERSIDDREGWMEANPALADGKNAAAHWAFLERMLSGYQAAGTPEIFQTEHLCQWVDSELPRLVSDFTWEQARVESAGEPVKAAIGLAKDPAGKRVSAAVAWREGENIHAYLLADLDGHPVDLEAAAERVLPEVRRLGAAKRVMYDPWTDNDWARHFPDARKLVGQDWETACRVFSEKLEAGRLRFEDPDGHLTLDMAATVRRETAHGWIAVRASDERPNTGALALIRAVWLATMPAVQGPRVW